MYPMPAHLTTGQLGLVTPVVAVQVGKDRLVDARHEFGDLRAGEPAHGVEFVAIADDDGVRVCAPGRAGREVDHLTACLGMNASAEDAAGDDLESGSRGGGGG
jgi:hypothetical protein